jgi:hypothetical protein
MGGGEASLARGSRRTQLTVSCEGCIGVVHCLARDINLRRCIRKLQFAKIVEVTTAAGSSSGNHYQPTQRCCSSTLDKHCELKAEGATRALTWAYLVKGLRADFTTAGPNPSVSVVLLTCCI